MIKSDLSGKNLEGTIPLALSGLTNLREIYLGSNNLIGTIPPLNGLSNLILLLVLFKIIW